MNTITATASVGAGVSRSQAVYQSPKLTEQQRTPETSSVRAAAELLQRVLALPDTSGHDLDVVA
ncbi:MAG TPA: hypothetical protein PKI11_04595 [Candidatus Hydrogenedentes bacterium]|nr:hypothetical protein [Candidatus Hydrogenedentota bacterium]HNT87581.1 hypothetical protein [Candidatus Hydrogenedentota bacterium]